MIKFVGIYSALVLCGLLLHPKESYSSEKLIEASVSALAEYNDNIFLNFEPQDAVSSLIIKPSLSGVVKEQNWQAKLNTQLIVNQYSDRSLDSNGQLLDLTGQYSAERNVFSINIGHDIISSLSTISADFGLSSQRINRKTQSISPQYTRLLTERLALTLSYSYSDTEYLDIEDDARFVSSYTKTGSAALRYSLTGKDQVGLNFQAVDYTRKDKLGDIQLFDVSVNFGYKFSDTISIDFAAGVSRRNSTNLQESTFDFIGVPAFQNTETNVRTQGNTFNLEVRQLLETGNVGVRLSRNATTNSFGGLNETDRFVLSYDERLSLLWRYSIAASYEGVTSESVATTIIDRELVSLEARMSYSITTNWNMNLSYRYVQREFKNISRNENTPRSNRLQIGLRYNLPALITF